MKDTQFVGLDVHKETIAVAVAKLDRGEAESIGTIPNNPQAVAKLLRKLGPAEGLQFCYEAGPCGYGLYRQLVKAGAMCTVVAPSLIPQSPGDRVKTDRRDAQKLARLLRSGDLTPVWVPDEQQEALRDLTRAREDAKEDLLRKRNQLSKFLLRLDLRPPTGIKAWTKAYRQWIEGLQFTQGVHKIVLAEYLHALDETTARIERLEKELVEQATTSSHAPLISALQSLRGVAAVTAITVVAELGDLTRFPSAKQAMDYVGLVPSEHSSGGRRSQGAITKSGNSHARYVLVEAAWHYRHAPRVGETLQKRQQGLSEEVKRIAWKAQHRLNLKYRRLVGRGKMKQVAVVAVARELVGFMWAIAQELFQQKAVSAVA
jgi:transposase